jgi:hypothetical protein
MSKRYRPVNYFLEGKGIQPYRGRGYPRGYLLFRKNCPSVIIPELKYRKKTLKLMADWKIKRKKLPTVFSEQAVITKLRAYQWLVNRLSEIYCIRKPKVKVGKMSARSWKRRPMSRASYDPETHIILLRSDFSTLQLLHEFAHARNLDETDAVIWSFNLTVRMKLVKFC